MATMLRMNTNVRLLFALHWRRKASCNGLFLPSLVAPSSTRAENGMASSHTEPRSFSEIPGPRSWPLLGSSLSTYFDPVYDDLRLYRLWESYFKRYGPIFKVKFLGSGNTLFICDIHDIEQVIKETSDNPVRPFFYSLMKIRDMKGEEYFKNRKGILIEHGEEWWRVRSRVQVQTMKPRTMAQYLPQMDQVAQDFIARCAGQRDQNEELVEDFLPELCKWAMESLGLVCFGRRIGCLDESEEGAKIIKASLNFLKGTHDCEYKTQWWKFFTTPTLRRMQEAHDILLETSMAAVQQSQVSLKAKTLDEKEEEEGQLTLLESLVITPGLTFQDVVTFITDFLIAGIDTTSVTVLFVMYNLARNPDKQAKLHKELDQVLGNGTEVLTEKHLAKLSYTKACVKESLRLYPPTQVLSRQLTRDMILQGYTIPCGTKVFMGIGKSGKNEEYFPRATEFIPERWLRDSNLGRINRYASLPFSTGTRMCVGRRLSEQEIYTFLSRFFLKYDLDYKYEAWDPMFKVLLEPDKHQKFTMRERVN